MEIAAASIAFVQAADKTIGTIRGFIVDCRDARSDLSAVNRELSELKLTLNILEDLVPDGSQTGDPLPSSIRDDIRSIIKNCLDVAKEIDDVLLGNRGRFAAVSWAAKGKQKVNSLRAVLEAHRRALNLAVDTITLAMTKSIKNDTEDILEETADIKQDTTDIKEDTTKVLEEIARLEALIRNNIPAESSKLFLLNRYLYDLTSVAGSVCGNLSRPGTPEPVSGRPSTFIATEAALGISVPNEPNANKLKARQSEANNLEAKQSKPNTGSSTPIPLWAPMSLPTRKPLPASKPPPGPTPSSMPKPLAVTPRHIGAKNHWLRNLFDRVPGDSTRSLPIAPPNNQQQSQSGSLPKRLESRPALVLDQRCTLAGNAAIVFFGQETCVVPAHSVLLSKSTSFAYSVDTFLSKDRIFRCGPEIRLSDDETKLYEEYDVPRNSSGLRVFDLTSMKWLCSFRHQRGPLASLTTDGSIFYVIDPYIPHKTLIYDWTTGCSRDNKTGIPGGFSINLSLPIDRDRGLYLLRPHVRGVVKHLHLYQVSRTGPGGSGIKVEDVVLSETRAATSQCGCNYSHDDRRIISFFNIRTNPTVEIWNFGDNLTANGDLRSKVRRAEKRTFPLKRHIHPNGKKCTCDFKSVAIAGNLVVVVSYVFKPRPPYPEEDFVTGWNLDTGEVVFQHQLGKWNLSDSFDTKLSRDAKILQLSRKANSKEEEEWRKSRDFKSAHLHSVLEIDGKDLRLVQNFATFGKDDRIMMMKDTLRFHLNE
ncbi:hypothetical protein CEP52_003380 [Fusarium oligoseptatum]|uniref:Fungal N-terminal domain-containing protein n=1 Tax=Fusarium oligoseptatum TaxID=2604345 RepID=A0A428U954_9HYPO|nr:hypothetical protein CEP52_003380 [Fusarium oligoseptatum]